MKRQRVSTKDGSHSFYIPELDEHYHSVHGAIQESRHVFIEAGFQHIAQRVKSVNLLEVGFGTGLNALLTLLVNDNIGASISYEAIEALPLTANEVESLNYPDLLGAEAKRPQFLRMHECIWGNPIPLENNFRLTKILGKLEELELPPNRYHLVYFDAFAPGVQPELWTESIFKSVYDAMKPDGVLVTYCAKGSVKRAMAAAGFIIEKLPGPKGKREMTRAIK